MIVVNNMIKERRGEKKKGEQRKWSRGGLEVKSMWKIRVCTGWVGSSLRVKNVLSNQMRLG